MNLTNYLSQTQSEEVKYWINHNLANYLQKNNENVSEIEHIIDYFNATNPARLKKMSYQDAARLSKDWLKTEIKKGNDIEEGTRDIEIVKDFGDGFNLVRLIGDAAFKREGYLMSHCVGSYAAKTNTAIYSLRDSRNMPHCTIEVVGKNQVQQIKGKGNGSIHPNYIKYIIDTLKYFGMPVRDSEMENLGYINLDNVTPGAYDYVAKIYKNLKWVEFNKTKYVYIKSLE